MPLRTSSGRVSATATPKVNKDDSEAQNNTPTSTRSGRSIKKPDTISPYFNKSTGKKGKGKKAQGDSGEDDSHDSTELTSGEENSSDDDEGSEDEFGPSEDDQDGAGVEDSESEAEPMDSDFVDEDDDYRPGRGKRRESTARNTKTPPKRAKTSAKANGQASSGKKKELKMKIGDHEYIEGYDDEEDDMTDTDLEDGQEIAGRIYPAPKTGQVPPGQISQNTLNFLKNLQIPERNDRDWFKSHEPSFRQAEKEWKSFVGIMQQQLSDVDDEVPVLPPSDVIHRIYRDIRFSSDKTPYKKGLSFTTSRGGRKGHFGSYHLYISPNGRSLLAGGIWMPDKNQTASIRHRILTEEGCTRFRKVIEEKEFVKWFGEAKEKKRERRNVFGHDDALKVAPKGVDKEHRDIDLLKLRTVAVVHHFTDEEVVDPDFQDKVKVGARVMLPFIRMLNDFVSLSPDNDE
ncbi:hypothetical protein J007_00778 [Cryptococcus neoformans]|nr:hypothetical protein J007_00778 [Cryptococcus neoformans var. grubii]OXC64928.1 hypothetical protein C358_00778 [Cryptococcus neoformans var. grubii MW-RSA852]